ncbi:MAG: ATP-grasp fold amidoligase family protein [Pseudomonadota bacterium]
MNVVFRGLERVFAACVFLAVEIGIVLTAPGYYWQSVQRARSFGRIPFHAYPRSADEKFLWRKLFDHDPRFTLISDKLALRDWIAETGLELRMPRLCWAGLSPRSIPEELWFGDYVVKANHDSGSAIALWDDPPARETAIAQLEAALERDYSRAFAEWGYKLIAPRVFVEERVGQAGSPVGDIKFYTFGRRIERIVHIEDRPGGRFGQVFEPDGAGGFYRLERAPAVCDGTLETPLDDVLGRAVEMARALGERFDHMRVDFLEAGGTLYLSEMTVYNQTGYITDGGAFPHMQVSRAWDIRRSFALRTRHGGPFTRLYLGVLKRALDRAGASDGLPPA